MRKIALLLVTVSSLFLVSCVTQKPLASTPPAKKLIVKEKFVWGDGALMKRMTFPQGEYTPQFEGKEGYYYAAPGGIRILDFPMSYGVEGGVFWKRFSDKPTHLYHTTPITKTRARLPWGNEGRLEAIEVVR